LKPNKIYNVVVKVGILLCQRLSNCSINLRRGKSSKPNAETCRY